MRRALTNFYCVFLFSVLICLLSLGLSLWLNDVEWFQASGAVVTVGGVLLAARKIIRLGLEEFLRDESTIDGGHIEPTPEEIEHNRQFELDVKSYRWSVALLIVGTLVWAYGGIGLRMLAGVGS
ncbi:hypothetical protein HOP61_08210 [Halomonas daqingensis]|uniref:Uncharacterized protein n=1 Tax=Billgrantia desiderata TaxID=52021 RepID=A0AAW4YT16_9GAMM|nr:hypothetical protein [Halomonas desiderata]MCE8051270.1 hypothetical protein [Halomonas desiderata]